MCQLNDLAAMLSNKSKKIMNIEFVPSLKLQNIAMRLSNNGKHRVFVVAFSVLATYFTREDAHYLLHKHAINGPIERKTRIKIFRAVAFGRTLDIERF